MHHCGVAAARQSLLCLRSCALHWHIWGALKCHLFAGQHTREALIYSHGSRGGYQTAPSILLLFAKAFSRARDAATNPKLPVTKLADP